MILGLQKPKVFVPTRVLPDTMRIFKRHFCSTSMPLLLLVAAVVLPLSRAWAETIFVQVESAKLRAAPQPWAKVVSDLRFGDSLTSRSTERGWIAATSAGSIEGYLHETAVTKKKLVLKSVAASLADLSVSDSDVYLAGKGFNSATEQLLAQENKTLNYAAVNEMIGTAQSVDADIESFRSAGKLE